MKEEQRFQRFIKKAEDDIQLLQQEFSYLANEIQAGNDTLETLTKVREQWNLMENLLRKMATINKVEQRNKIKQLRISLINRLKQDKKTSPTLWSCTHKGQSLNDILKAVKKRRNIFNCWLDQHPEHLQGAVVLHKQALKLINDILVLMRKLERIELQNKEISALKKSTDKVSKFFNENKDVLDYWFMKESPSLTAITQYFPERKELNTTNVKDAVNLFKNSNITQCIHVPLHCTCKQRVQKETKNLPLCKINAQGDVRNFSKKCTRTARKGIKCVQPLAIDQQAGFNYKIEYITRNKRKKLPIVTESSNTENTNEDKSCASGLCKKNNKKTRKIRSDIGKPRITKNENKSTSETNVSAKSKNDSSTKLIENTSTPTLDDGSNDVSNIFNEYHVPTPVSIIGTESNVSFLSSYPRNKHDMANALDVEIKNKDFSNNYSFQYSRFTQMSHNPSTTTAGNLNSDRLEPEPEENQFIVPDFIPDTVTSTTENESTFNNEEDLRSYDNLNIEQPYQQPSQCNSNGDEIYSPENNSLHCNISQWSSSHLSPNSSTWSMHDNNWEEGLSACRIPSNETITESRAWVYKQNNLPVPQIMFSTGIQLRKQQPNHISCDIYNLHEIKN